MVSKVHFLRVDSVFPALARALDYPSPKQKFKPHMLCVQGVPLESYHFRGFSTFEKPCILSNWWWRDRAYVYYSYWGTGPSSLTKVQFLNVSNLFPNHNSLSPSKLKHHFIKWFLISLSLWRKLKFTLEKSKVEKHVTLMHFTVKPPSG